jgi:hypothetical protein
MSLDRSGDELLKHDGIRDSAAEQRKELEQQYGGLGSEMPVAQLSRSLPIRDSGTGRVRVRSAQPQFSSYAYLMYIIKT